MKELKQKRRLSIARQYVGKNIWIRFTDSESGITYRYPHDGLINLLERRTPSIFETRSWRDKGPYHWPNIPSEQGYKYPYLKEWLSDYQE